MAGLLTPQQPQAPQQQPAPAPPKTLLDQLEQQTKTLSAEEFKKFRQRLLGLSKPKGK